MRDAGIAARRHGAAAIRALASIATDPKAPATARVAAAGKLLERGYGRGMPDSPGEDELAMMSDEELNAALRRHIDAARG